MPYDPWLERFPHVSVPYPYRAGLADAHPLTSACGATALANGFDGDATMLAPPFIITGDELERVSAVVTEAIFETTEGWGSGSHVRGRPHAVAVAAKEAGV